MEINTNIIIGLFFVAIIILLFSKISISMGSNETPQYISSNNLPKYEKNINNYNNNVSLAESQGFPEKNSYMSNSLRNQINDLENRFYYNNCRWEPNF